MLAVSNASCKIVEQELLPCAECSSCKAVEHELLPCAECEDSECAVFNFLIDQSSHASLSVTSPDPAQQVA